MEFPELELSVRFIPVGVQRDGAENRVYMMQGGCRHPLRVGPIAKAIGKALPSIMPFALNFCKIRR